VAFEGKTKTKTSTKERKKEKISMLTKTDNERTNPPQKKISTKQQEKTQQALHNPRSPD
jgi:hypothetical protein